MTDAGLQMVVMGLSSDYWRIGVSGFFFVLGGFVLGRAVGAWRNKEKRK